LFVLAGLLVIVTMLNPVAGADGESTDVHFTNGLVYYALGFTDMATRELQRVCELAPTNVEARMALGMAYQAKGDLNNALKAYQEILSVDDSLLYIHGLIGDVYRSKGDGKKAQFHYLKAREDTELVVIPSYGLGVLAEEAGDLAIAIDYYREVLDIGPDHVDTALRLAHLLSLTGDIDGGLQVLSEANRYNPREPELHYQWGLLYLEKADYNEALHEFDRVLQLESGHEGARQELRKLESLLNKDRPDPLQDQ
jgi:tetratricopeptide (TPR) repeat protein